MRDISLSRSELLILKDLASKMRSTKGIPQDIEEIVTQKDLAANEVGSFWKAQRLNAGLLQLEISEQMGYGSPQIISNIERGACGVPMDRLSEYCKILKVNKAEAKKILLAEYSKKLDEALAGK